MKKLLNLHLDYPGILIGGELRALRLFVESLNDYVPHICDQYRIKETVKAEKNKDEEFPGILDSQIKNIENVSNVIIPQSFNNSALLMIWSFFESSVKDLGLYIRKRKNIELIIKDISGEGLIRIQKYYSSVLGLPNLLEPYIDDLSAIYLIRNLIVHANGVISSPYESTRKLTEKSKISKYIQCTDGIEDRNGMLLLSNEYINGSLNIVTDAIKAIDDHISNENEWMSLIN